MRAADDIADARQDVLDAAEAAGMDAERANLLAFAASEMVTNALVHGGGAGEVGISVTDDAIVVTVRDRGPGFTPAVGPDRPDPAAEGGRGLWLAEQLCDDMTIDSGPHGTTVRLTMHRLDRDRP